MIYIMSRTIRKVRKWSLKNRARDLDTKIERLDNWYTIPTMVTIFDEILDKQMSLEMCHEWIEMMVITRRELFS
jgi:hypothetical protein